MRDQVLVLNFNDAASRAVARKLRAERVLCKIVPGNAALEDIREQDPLGLLLAGGTAGTEIIGLDQRILKMGLPVLALGDAAASLLKFLGGEAGPTVLEGTMARLSCRDVPLLRELDGVERLLPRARALLLPTDVLPLCQAQDTVIAFGHESLPLFGIQFEVEAVDPDGTQLLKNFALGICCCTPWWDDDAFAARAVEEIRRVVGGGRAACAMTGGLDSGVSALLAFKALGSQLKCLFVDTGLLRENEAADFMAFYRDQVGMDIVCIQARERFLHALAGKITPEEKRRAIGDTLQSVLNENREGLGPFDVLIRGTSYHDIMFGSGEKRPVLDDTAPVIEPVRELFKDEVRRVGDFLGIPGDLMSRQPFPGGGLALRILGEATEERIAILRRADAIFRSEIQRSGASRRLWQYFAVLCPLPEEEGGAVICLRAVHATEQSLAYAARLPYDVTESATERIMREVPQVRRVVYDLTPSSHYTGIEWQ